MRYGLTLLGVAALLYLANTVLIGRYIKRAVPKLLEIDSSLPKPVRDEKYLWEYTAGTGVVPKWVSAIGLLAIACLAIGGIVVLVAWLR